MTDYHLRILHISDLHARHDDSEPRRTQRVLGAAWQKNLEELASTYTEDRSIDLVCVTGDVSQSAHPDQYSVAARFFEHILHCFRLDRARLFLVPGNHDIDREVVKKKWSRLRRNILQADPLLAARWLAYCGKRDGDAPPPGLRNADRENIFARQEAYRAFLLNLDRGELLPKNELHPRLGFRSTFQKDGLPFDIHIIGLDSAWLAGDDYDAGRLLLTDSQVYNLTSNHGNDLEGFRLALIHHPLEDLADGNQAQCLLAESVDLLLRGHLHQPKSSLWTDPNRTLLQFAAGCLYEHDRYSNAFQVIDIKLDSDGRPLLYKLHFRGWSQQGFWYDDNALYEGTREGRLDIWPTRTSTRTEPTISIPKIEPTINIERMPRPLSDRAKLVGRAEYLRNLIIAFDNPDIAVVAVIGIAGVGKSFLIDAFLKNLAHEDYKGVAAVYAWSFYDQGSHTTESSSMQFFVSALPFFGHKGDIPSTEGGKAERLSELMSEEKCLLVLDGIETLQYAPHVNGGVFSDQAMGDFLRLTARRGKGRGGLVLVASRSPLKELQEWSGDRYREILLDTLEHTEGGQLLRNLGVNGSDKELELISGQMGRNPLALVLLGHLLLEHFDGDVKRTPRLPEAISCDDASRHAKDDASRHAKRVMQWYDDLWRSDAAPERVFLHLLGLFGRPMDGRELRVLLARADVARQSSLADLTDDDWAGMENRLKQAGLAHRASIGRNVTSREDYAARWEDETRWDAHPLVREFYGDKLRIEDPLKWRQAHQVLFDHFKGVATEEQPSGAEGLEPLYRAVYHGCLAEEYRHAYYIYRHRIARDDKGYDTENLGFTMQALVALQNFFPEGFENDPAPVLDEADQAWVLARASYCHDSAGQLELAEKLRHKSNVLFTKLSRLNEAATGLEELAVLQTRLGKLGDAISTAYEAIGWSDSAVRRNIMGMDCDANLWQLEELNKSKVRQYATRAAAATVLHRQGKLVEALSYFETAEQMAQQGEQNICLHSVPGIRYCSLLLDMAQDRSKEEQVLERADKMIRYGDAALKDKFPLMCDLHRLNRGRVLAELGNWLEASQEIEQALEGIREKHKIQFDCQPHLARASIRRQAGDLDGAREDLREVLSIGEECSMPLYCADAYLLLGHVELDVEKLDAANDALRAAGHLIGSINFKLRYADVYLLDARCKGRKGRLLEARRLLANARTTYETLGYWRLSKDYRTIQAELNVPEA